MSRILLVIAVVFGLIIAVPAQQRKHLLISKNVRFSKQKPTVYITFVRFGKREPRHTNESEEGVWLRVHNNTRWPLFFNGVGGFTRNDEEVKMFYGVEEVPKPQGFSYSLPQRPLFGETPVQAQPSEPPKVEKVEKDCDVPPGDWNATDAVIPPIRLPPGKSLLFSVPRETLCKNLKIYIDYNYAWESKDNNFVDEPKHRVYFYGADLSGR